MSGHSVGPVHRTNWMSEYYANPYRKFKQNRCRRSHADFRYNPSTMADADQLLEQQFLEMRWRVLSLAADIDRIQRASGRDWESLVRGDKRLQKLASSLSILNGASPDRAEQVQMLFSDQTPRS